MTERDQEEQDRSIELMETQTRLYAKQDRWEIVKALAAIIAASAVMTGAIIGLSNYLHPSSQQPMFPPGTVITIPTQGVTK